MAQIRLQRSQTEEEYAATMFGAISKAAVILAVFTVVVLGTLIMNTSSLKSVDPRNAKSLKALKTSLRAHPRDEKIKEKIRLLDARLRAEYLRRLDFARTGGWLLFLGVGGLLIAVPAAAQYRVKMIVPDKEEPAESVRMARLGRQSVTVFGVVVAAGFIYLAVASRGNLNAAYVKAVKEYDKNPQPTLSAAANPLAGLPAAMLQNMAGRLPAPPAGGILPAPAPANSPVAGAPGGAVPTNLPTLPTIGGTGTGNLPPLNPLVAGGVKPVAPAGGQEPKPSGLKSEAAFDSGDYAPSAEEFAKNWPVFRGPASGVAGPGFPTTWNGQTGENIVWKTTIGLPGWNSPVVWKDRVFLTGANEKEREVYCFDADSGKLLWKESAAPLKPGKAPEVMEDTGYAASTAATDGKRVFAIFPNGDIFAYDFQGKRLWSRSFGMPDSQYGYAASLTSFRSLVIVQFDQGSDSDGKSYLLALQGSTGKIVWAAKRPVGGSWASPTAVRDGDSGIIITNANPWTIAYDAASGKELWRASLMSGDVAPSPACTGGLAYVCNSGAVLAGIKLGGSGDVTKSHVAWQASDGLPDITSPATDGNLLFLMTTEGTATCYDAKQGKKLWDHGYETTFKASPVIAEGKVYLLDANGVAHIIEAKAAFKEDGKAPLGEPALATPAFAGGRIYIRGEKHLFCIGAK